MKFIWQKFKNLHIQDPGSFQLNFSHVQWNHLYSSLISSANMKFQLSFSNTLCEISMEKSNNLQMQNPDYFFLVEAQNPDSSTHLLGQWCEISYKVSLTFLSDNTVAVKEDGLLVVVNINEKIRLTSWLELIRKIRKIS